MTGIFDRHALELRHAVAARLPDIPTRPSPRRDPLEARCRSFLELLRWPAGVRCPRCDESVRLHRLEARDKWHCYTCTYQFSVTAGTLFHRSHLPLWKWFASIHLMTHAQDGITSLELAERIGGSYKSHWFTTHRIRLAMRAATMHPAPVPAARRPGAAKYRDAYDGERRWLAENRGKRSAFTDVVKALLEQGPVSYRELTA